MAKRVTKQQNPVAGGVTESARHIWLAGLGAFSRAQKEGGKVFESLVKQGHQLESHTREMAGDRVEMLASRATGTLDKLEHVFEERVARAMKALGVPTAKDVDRLARRVAELDTHVEELIGKKARPAARRAPRAKKAA